MWCFLYEPLGTGTSAASTMNKIRPCMGMCICGHASKFNWLRMKQNGHHFLQYKKMASHFSDIFNFFLESYCILITISLNDVPQGLIEQMTIAIAIAWTNDDWVHWHIYVHQQASIFSNKPLPWTNDDQAHWCMYIYIYNICQQGGVSITPMSS